MSENHYRRSEAYKWSKEEIASINQCAEVLQLREHLLQRVVWHLQNIDDSMMDETIKSEKIQDIVISIKADDQWFVSSETDTTPFNRLK